jgi:hypothetical protein
MWYEYNHEWWVCVAMEEGVHNLLRSTTLYFNGQVRVRSFSLYEHMYRNP